MTNPADKGLTDKSIFRRYWEAYGGFRAVLASGYFWLSVIVTLACYRLWTAPGWWDNVLSILPNLLGFSLGGFALWLAIGDDGFRKIISKRSAHFQFTVYAQINASFVHFIVLQVAALVCALVAKGLNFELANDSWLLTNFFEEFYVACGVGAFIGFLLFVYALMSALAATLGLLQITYMYESYLNKAPQSKPQSYPSFSRKLAKRFKSNH